MAAAPGVWEQVLKALDRHGRLAMVTLAATRGSSPREAGARMLVNPDGTFTGTIGGGTLEWKTIAMAQAALANPSAPKAEARGFALGPELGQCCGGNVDVIVEIIENSARDTIAGFARREAEGALVTRGRLSAEKGVLREIADVEMEPGSASFSGGVLTEGFGDARRALYVFGAGHVGRALVFALAPLPFDVTWLDARAEAFPGFTPGNTTARIFTDPAAELAAAPDGAFVLVMTHSHQLDLAIVSTALGAGRFPYVGLIGSKSKRARFTRMLAAAGISGDRIASLVCPIGIAGVHSKAPGVIAAATVAEMLVRDEVLRAASAPLAPAHDIARRAG
jgi:xanthine dehydrogenase accessory factor